MVRPRGHPRTYPKSTFRLMFKFDSVAYTPKTLGEKNARQSPWMTPQRGAPTLAFAPLTVPWASHSW